LVAVPTCRLFSNNNEKCFEPEKQGFLQSRQLRVKLGCPQSGSAELDESFARPGRAVVNDVGERTYDSKRLLNFKAKTPSSPIVSGAHFCGENDRFGWAIRRRQRRQEGKTPAPAAHTTICASNGTNQKYS
jgi:hypothetical protein